MPTDETPSAKDEPFGDLRTETSSSKATPGKSRHRHPKQVGPYKILKMLGEGGMGVVYLAQQETPIRRRVALKLIKLGMDTRNVIARFESERQALAVMNHSNVAKVLDAGATEQGRPYFVMEHVEGIRITEYCDRHRLNTKERLDLFMEVCNAVQHAHQKGIIHRDIKPSNVLVAVQEGKPVPKVIDFGVAKATQKQLTEKTLFTEQGQLIGTPAYMSPEQAEMTALDIDTRTDIYSLGVLLYELLTGTLPFEPRSLRRAAYGDIRRVIREQDAPKPSTRLCGLGDESGTIAIRRGTDLRALERELRGDLDWITMKAMEKDRTRRYASASDFAADILRHLQHEPVVAGPPGAAYRVKKFVRRKRGLVTAAAVVLTVLIAGIAGTTIALIDAIESRALAEEKQHEAQAQRAEAERQAAIAQAVNDFLNNDLLAAVAPEEQGKDISMREVLDKASDAIEGKFEGEPLVEASIRSTLGATYTALGVYTQAEPHLKRALHLHQNELGNDHPETLTSTSLMGHLRRSQGKLTEAEQYYREALESYRRVLGDDHPETLASINNMGLVLRPQGKLTEAEDYYREALEGYRRVLGDDHPHTLASVNNMGSLLRAMGKFEEAEPYCREALKGTRRVLGDDHPRTLTATNNMGVLLQQMGKFEEAHTHYLKALEGRRRVLGNDHPHTLMSINSMGLLLQAMGKFEDAERLYREILSVRRRTRPVDDPEIGSALIVLGLNLVEQKKYVEAERVLRESLEIRQKALSQDHWLIPNTMTILGEAVAGQEKFDEAEALLLQGYAGMKDNPQAPDKNKTQALKRVIKLYESWSKPEKAAEWRAMLPKPSDEAESSAP